MKKRTRIKREKQKRERSRQRYYELVEKEGGTTNEAWLLRMEHYFIYGELLMPE